VRRGVRLGVDVGDVRIGVAASDPSGLIATPVETVARGAGDLSRLRALAEEHDAFEVVVGLPRSLSGREGPAAAKVRLFATALADLLAAGQRARQPDDGLHRLVLERQGAEPREVAGAARHGLHRRRDEPGGVAGGHTDPHVTDVDAEPNSSPHQRLGARPTTGVTR